MAPEAVLGGEAAGAEVALVVADGQVFGQHVALGGCLPGGVVAALTALQPQAADRNPAQPSETKLEI